VCPGLRYGYGSHAKDVHDPLQHVPPSTHGAPVGAHASHVPDALQRRLQHSRNDVQETPPTRHASHVPDGPQCTLQQSLSAAHEPPSDTQQPTP
jgi:hypothetical protein